MLSTVSDIIMFKCNMFVCLFHNFPLTEKSLKFLVLMDDGTSRKKYSPALEKRICRVNITGKRVVFQEAAPCLLQGRQ
jgi:hypothetical protein